MLYDKSGEGLRCMFTVFSDLWGGGAFEFVEGLVDDLLDHEVPRERQRLGHRREIQDVDA